MEKDKVINKYDKLYIKNKEAERTLKWCAEICDSYFQIGRSKNDEHNARYQTILTIIDTYYKMFKEEEGESDENRGVQSKYS